MRSGLPQRTLSAFSPHHYSSSNDPLSQPAFLRAKECSAITATKPKRFRPAHIRDSHPIPLVQLNKNACPVIKPVAHLPQKLRIQFLEGDFGICAACFAAFRADFSCRRSSLLAAFFSRLARLSAVRWRSYSSRKSLVFSTDGADRLAAAPDADAGERFPPAAEAQLDEVAADHLGARRARPSAA